jgi:hypothetical protein
VTLITRKADSTQSRLQNPRTKIPGWVSELQCRNGSGNLLPRAWNG